MHDGAGSWHLPGEARRSSGQLPTPRPQPPRSPPRKANPPRLWTSSPDIRFLLEYSSQVWERRAQLQQIQMHEAEPTGNSHFTKSESQVRSPCRQLTLWLRRGRGGVVRGKSGVKQVQQGLPLRPWFGTHWNQRKGSTWFKGRPPNSAFKCIIFWMHPKDQARAVTLESDSLQFCGGSLRFQVLWKVPTGLTC